MPIFRAVFGPITKAAMMTLLGSATVNSPGVMSMDSPPVNLSSDTALVSHFSAMMSAAQSCLTSLVGAAPRVRCTVSGYHDPNVVAPHPGASGSSLKIEVTEIW